jgi:hypothetical protein
VTPVLVSGYFGADDPYGRLARVLAYSAAQACPDWDRRIDALQPRSIAGKSLLLGGAQLANTHKMEHWRSAIAGLPDGTRVLLIDADTMILRRLDDVWDLDFDLAYTTKASTRIPFNTGVIFARVSPAVRAFVDAWHAEQVAMLGHRWRAEEWRRLMIGLNQSALAVVFDQLGVNPRRDEPALVRCALDGDQELVLRRLPCLEWNCEDAHWQAFDPARTRIVHVKSELRAVACRRQPPTGPLRPLATMWRELEDAASLTPVLTPPSHGAASP